MPKTDGTNSRKYKEHMTFSNMNRKAIVEDYNLTLHGNEGSTSVRAEG